MYHILAVTSLQYGLNSFELKLHANAMSSIWKNNRSDVSWSGAPHELAQAIRKKIPYSIENLLVGAKNNTVSSKDLAKRLSIDWNPKNQNLINASLQLLEIAGLVKKMPLWIQPNGIQLSVWTHARTRNPSINYPNLGINILNRLQKAPLLVSQLQKQYRIPSTSRGKKMVIGSTKGVFSAQIYKGVKRLEEAGLIRLERDIKHRRNAGEVKIMYASLTSLGNKLLSEHNKTHRTPEVLRRLLLGEKEK